MTIPDIVDVEFRELLQLEPHGPDTFVGIAARYPWGGRLFGGQIIAQALRAAAATVDTDRPAHSLHSYFIRPGSPNEPVRYEVERLRNGRSFSTRQVVARQSGGAILNLSVSFQIEEDEADAQLAALPDDMPTPDDPSLQDTSWGALIERKAVDLADGRLGYWIRLTGRRRRRPDRSCLCAGVHVRRRPVTGRPIATPRLRAGQHRPASGSRVPASTMRSGSTATATPTNGTGSTRARTACSAPAG